jgi:hypothetical protein
MELLHWQATLQATLGVATKIFSQNIARKKKPGPFGPG